MISVSLFSQPWAIHEPAFASLCRQLAELQPTLAQPQAFLDLQSLLGDPAELEIDDAGIATIPIEGVLMQKPDIIDRVFFGATSMAEIQDQIEEAAQNAAVKGIFLDIDSAGGTVMGTPELGNAVRSAANSKPVYAFTSGLMCSAAYWIGSQADAVYATPSSRVGSVGVIMQVPNRVEQLRKAGIKVETFTAGAYKGAGSPVIDMPDHHKAMFQESVDSIHASFKETVLSRRKNVMAADMEGQDFSGTVAASKGFVSGIVQSKTGAKARLLARL